ncbi:MAG: hypothetical protein RSA29_14705 [Clostridium sp.]|uniref:hypothetical protein n=1 Tax=Clostridium sp. TaxID=1506 RepID=UPI0032163D29
MSKFWKLDYKGHKITVENTWFNGERLYVDDELQDEQVGLSSRSRLFGIIKFGDGSGESIKVSLGGVWVINCRIFIDNKLVTSNR